MAIDLGNDPGGTPPTTAEKLQIRSAIGVGTTDAPTFLAQTLTGQSLTGTQATSLVDLSATWDTTGNPSLIYGRVTNTNSGTTANLIDLGTFAGGSLFKVAKNGAITNGSSISANGIFQITSATGYFSGYNNGFYADHGAIIANQGAYIGFSAVNNSASNGADTLLFRDGAPGILAQRNVGTAQTFRVYNSTDATPATNFDRASFGFPTSTNTLRIGTENGGTYTLARPIDFVTGGVVRMSIAAAGYVGIGTTTPSERLEIWGNAGQTTAKITSVSPGTGSNFILSGAFGQVYNEIGDLYITNNAASSSVVIRAGGAGAQLRFTPAGLLQLGGTTSAFPAIKRNGTGIDIRLADDSAFAPVKGKLTTDTNYTAGVPSATGYLTIYDATGTAYRVPCTV